MYGLLLENMAEFIRQKYGEDKWEDIRRQAGVEQPSFSVHQVYPENLIARLGKKAQQVLGVSEREFMDQMGVHFVRFVSQYGYDRVLSVLGRHMRDFLNGLDNLHEYLKFSYPRMRAPSFICENETRQGLTLHYRSKRRGFVYYAMGQIREVARHFYHKEMRIELVREELLFDTVHVTFQLTFDNRAFTLASLAMTREEKHLPISASVLFEIFPFCIVFGSDMVVKSIGNSLMVILPDLLGKKITNWFDLVRPLIAFKFQTILNRTNNIFELVTVETVLADRPLDMKGKDNTLLMSDEVEMNSEKNLRLKEKQRAVKPVKKRPKRKAWDGRELPDHVEMKLKGQMIYMDNWRMMMYLGTPVMPDLSSLIKTGLYINDLSMHDFSRDLMLAGTQQSVELKLALDQEQQKSKKLEESMRKLDEEMRRTDELLYQMIPKQVADRLRKGENPIDTCEMFDSVSILFSDVVTFTEICSRITPMEVVSMLNAMYSIFDTLTERNGVYKVETIGDAYMVVSGAPDKEDNHAEKVCDMALDMIDAITDLKDPSTGSHLQIRVGVHSGAVVAGIVGLKMPRYCLFGDSVNTASRMESTSEAMKIHISQTTKELLSPMYNFTERGEVQVKGKGVMKTYWLECRDSRRPLSKVISAKLKLESDLLWERAAEARDSINLAALHNPDSSSHTQQTASQMNMAAMQFNFGSNPPALRNWSPTPIFEDYPQSVSTQTVMSMALACTQTSPQLSTPATQTIFVTPRDSQISISEARQIYSPVTIQEVTRRSHTNSPIKQITNIQSSSIIIGGEFTSITADYGSLVSDSDGVYDLRARPITTPSSSSQIEHTSPLRLATAPAASTAQKEDFTSTMFKDYASESTRTLSPSHSAPAVINNPEILTIETPINIMTDYDEAESLDGPDFECNRGDLQYVEDLSARKPPAASKSDSNIVEKSHRKTKKSKIRMINSHSFGPREESPDWHHNHQHGRHAHYHCCGNHQPHPRHRISTNSCSIV